MPINFTLVHSGRTNDESDAAGDIGEVAVTGWLHFVAQLPEGQPALAPQQGDTGASYWVRTFYGYLDSDGVLKNKPGSEGGTPGVRLWANDPIFSLDELPYLVFAPKGLRANGKHVEFTAFVFNAPSSADEVKLSELQPVPSATAQGMSRGLRGHTPWFVAVPGTDPQLYQPTDPDGAVGPPVSLEAIVDPDQIVSVVDEAVPPLVAAAIGADGTVAAAAAAAVESDIAGRDLVQRSDPGIPKLRQIETSVYKAAVIGPNGELLYGERHDGTVEIPVTRTADSTTYLTRVDGLSYIAQVDADGRIGELKMDDNLEVPLDVLAAWGERGGWSSTVSTTPPLDIVILAGQSNATQRSSLPAVVEPATTDILEWNGTGFVPAAGVPWLGSGFARRYMELHGRPEQRRVSIVKAALGSTGFSSLSPGTWDRTVVSGADAYLYPEMIAKAQAALAAAPAGSRIVAVLWSQGEQDRNYANANPSNYQAKLDDLITQTRIDLAISGLPFIISSLTPEIVAMGSAGGAIVDAILEDTPRRLTRTAFVRGPAGMAEWEDVNSTGIHWTPMGQTLRGKWMAENGYPEALLNMTTSTPMPMQDLEVTRSGNTATITWRHPLSRVTAYGLETSTDLGVTWTAATLSAATTHKHVMTVTSGTPLWVRGRATNEYGTSFYTKEVHA